MVGWFFKSWLKHKWYVLVIGLQLDVPLWQLLIHDLSKLGSAERKHYCRSFYGQAELPNVVRVHHVRHNKHHWEGWVGKNMPKDYVNEMVADWAARCIVKGRWDLEEQFNEISDQMNWLTKIRVRAALDQVRSIKWQ